MIHKTLHERPRGRPHWSTRSLARAIGVSHSTVRRIWKSHGIQPHRSRVALLAEESPFRPKKVDLVGVYVNPPQRAVAISFGDSARPSGGIADRRPTPESKSPARPAGQWMMDLVTTLDLLDRREPLRASRRHVNQEFLSFLRSVQERRMGNEKIFLLTDVSGPSLSPQLVRWLSRHPQVSTEVYAGSEAWKEKVLESIRGATQGRSRDGPPAGLPNFLAAVAQRKREDDNRLIPFAWTR